MSYAVKGYEPPVADYIAGKYRIVDRLGEGSTGTVYEVEHAPRDGVIAIYRGDVRDMHGSLAVKVLHPHLLPHDDAEFIERFDNVMRTVRAVNHPRVLPVHDYGADDGQVYIAMPFLPGMSLRDVIAARAPLNVETVWAILRQVCSALAVFHSKRIFHLGLSADNIRITSKVGEAMEIQLLDLGISGILAGETKIIMVDEDDGVVGIPRYTAPEQVLGQECDARTDIYALGALLYDLLVGKMPFNEDLVMQTTMCHLNQYPIIDKQFIPDADIPEPVKAVVLKCLDLELKKRFQSVIEFLAALHAAIEGVSIRDALLQVEEMLAEPQQPAPPRAGRRPSFPPLRRRRIIADAVLAATFALLMFVASPYILSAKDALFGTPAQEEARTRALQEALMQRRETQRFWDTLNSEQAALERKISDLRNDLAVQTGGGFSRSMSELEERTEKVRVIRFALSTQEELLESLSKQVLEKSEAGRKLRARFDEAELQFRKKDFAAASTLYNQIAADFRALFKKKDLIYEAYAQKQESFDAEERWKAIAAEKNLKVNAPEEAARELRDQAHSSTVKGSYAAAIEAYRKLTELYENAPTSAPAIAESGKAIVTTSAGPPPTNVSFESAEALRAAGRYLDAAKAFKTVVEREPENIAARTALGNCYYNLRRFGEALVELKEALQRAPESAEVHYNVANTYYHLDRFDEARYHFEKTVSLDPTNETAYVNLGAAREKLNDEEGARAAYRQALKVNPKNAVASKNLKALEKKR